MGKTKKTQAETGTQQAPEPKPPRRPTRFPNKRRATSWKAGFCPNPKGRPKTGEALSEIVRAETSPKALIARMQWLADHAESETVRFHALNWLSERGYGKAPQEVVISEKNPYAKKVKGLKIQQLELIATIDEELFELEVEVSEPDPNGPSGVN